MNISNRPYIGVGILIIKDEKILMGKRRNSHGDGTWAPPGGHLEFFESPEECAQREVLEETGISIKNIHHIGFTNDRFVKENKHYITLYYVAEYDSGTPQILEPEKCLEWKWFAFNELPQELFLSFQNFLKQHTFYSFDYNKMVKLLSGSFLC
jgi:8-oxo-dGTP diphosphatase